MRKSKAQRTIERIYSNESEAWPRYVRSTVAINEEVRQRCQQELTERFADRDAEHDNPALARYHEAEADILQAQIDNCTRIILELTALPSGPGWIDAEKEPRRLLY